MSYHSIIRKNDKFKGSRQTLYLCPSLLCAGCGLRAWCLRHSLSSTEVVLNSSVDTTPRFCAQAADFVRGALAVHETLLRRVDPGRFDGHVLSYRL